VNLSNGNHYVILFESCSDRRPANAWNQRGNNCHHSIVGLGGTEEANTFNGDRRVCLMVPGIWQVLWPSWPLHSNGQALLWSRMLLGYNCNCWTGRTSDSPRLKTGHDSDGSEAAVWSPRDVRCHLGGL